MKPKLLIVELWGLGDLAIATPFIRAASLKFDITLVGKPFVADMQARFWPGVAIVTFTAPWTAFTGKYRLHRWPCKRLGQLLWRLRTQRFDWGLSGRWDPRDHIFLFLAGAKRRLGFPRLGSQIFLTHPLTRPEPEAHRYEYWRTLAKALGLELPEREALDFPIPRPDGYVLVHTGARLPVRVWPLVRYRNLVRRIRDAAYKVCVACDLDQRSWWLETGEATVATPTTVKELLELIDGAKLFIGNDSGPGHLAAFCGVPTFTIFGPQLPEWFAPLHPAAEWVEGKPCPYKPCSDYCRFPVPYCIDRVGEEEVWSRVERFLRRCPAEPISSGVALPTG